MTIRRNRPHPLTPEGARHTVAHRIGVRIAPRLRQFATKLGIRPHRVFLVWTQFSSGNDRGVGTEREFKRVELLPTPKVTSLDAVALSPTSVGIVGLGNVRLEHVSVEYGYDLLMGHVPEVTDGSDNHSIKQNVRFFYEIQEDGRGDDPAARWMFRPASQPLRRAGQVDWLILLERISEDETRAGESQLGDDD